MRRVMKRLINGISTGSSREEASTVAEIAEIALDNGEYKVAKEQAVRGLREMVRSQLHAEAIKFHCILMRAFYGMSFPQEADQYFSKALGTLDHHWGPFHPLHSTLYGIMAHLLISQSQPPKLEEAKYLYQSSLICSLRVLGPNHIRTAEVHTDYGRLHLRMRHNRDEALQHFEEAFLIYESYYGERALPTARAAIQIAQILEEQKGKLNDALKYATIATEAFRDIYGDESEHTINAQFLALSISYSLKNPKIRDLYEKLFEALLKRDRQFRDGEEAQLALPSSGGKLDQQQDFVEERIQEIKEYCIACMIMEMTRTLSVDDKQMVKSYCDRMLLREHQERQGGVSKGNDDRMMLDDYSDLPSLAELHQRIDHMKISSLSALKFDETGKKFLQQLYEETSQTVNFSSFSQYYKKILDDAILQVKEEQ